MPKLKYKPIEIGDKVNELTVIRAGESRLRMKHGKLYPTKYWICRCNCGRETVVEDSKLKSGWTKSCGCKDPKQLLRDIDDDIKKTLHQRAANIITRCTNPNHGSFMRYGGRGIKNELGDNLRDVLLSLAKVPGFFKGAQLDRIDPNGNYTLYHPVHGTEPWIYHDSHTEKDYQALGNLRWVDAKTNSMNLERCRENYPVEDVSKSIMSISGFKALCKLQNFNPDEFIAKDIEFELPSYVDKTRHKLFLHKSLTDDKRAFYYDRLKNIYEYWMEDIKKRIIGKPFSLAYQNPQTATLASKEYLDEREKRGDKAAWTRRYRARLKREGRKVT